MIRIYRNLEPAEQIVIGGDPGEAVSYSAGAVLSRTYNDVPIVFHSRVESAQFGVELFNLGLYISKKIGSFPLLAIERNIGAATIEKVRDLGYPLERLYRQKTFDRISNKTEERIGWVTTAACYGYPQ